MKEFNLTLGVVESLKVKPFEIVSQDINGNKLNINLVNDGSLTPYDLTGTTVILYFKRDDGVRLQQYGTIINAPQGQLEIILDTDIIATRGKVFAEVAVYQGEEMKCTSQLFGFYVRKNINDGETVVSGNDLPNYRQEMQRLETILDNLILSAGDSNPEIVAARYSMLEDKTFSTLGDRLDFIEDALQDIDIDLGPVEQMINNLAGLGRRDETVKGNADKILDLIADVGDLDNLETTEKANLVLSLNEIYQDLKSHQADTTTKFTTINTEITTIKNDIDGLENEVDSKADHSTVWSMANMGQDVKDAMTGGSVAIVGENAVDTINVLDSAVNTSKLDESISNLIGIEKIDYGWVLAATQTGEINPIAKNAASMENFIILDKDVKVVFRQNADYKYRIIYYALGGAYTGAVSGWHTTSTVIPMTTERKIRLEIRHLDERLIDSVYPLTQHLSVVKELRGASDVPAYWLSHLDSRINTIKTLQKDIGFNGTSFAFITDTHWNNNSKNSPVLLKRVMDECDIPYYFDGGDFASNPSGLTKQQQIDEIKEYKTAFSSLEDRVLRTIGNHEDNSINNLYSETITDKEMYDLMFRGNSKYQHIKNGNTGEYYYIDDEMHKMRYITLNCIDIPYIETENDGLLYAGMTHWAFRQEQIDWFADIALDVPSDDWGVVVCTHIAINTGYIKNDSIAMNILQAFKDKTTYAGSANTGTDFEVSKAVDYSGKGGNVICWLAGHRHIDSYVEMPVGIDYIVLTTLNDSLHVQSGAPTKTLGTTTENAFDVFTVDKINRQVNVTRIGAGSNRSFNY